MYIPLFERLASYRQTAAALLPLLRNRQIDWYRLPHLAENLLACLRDRQPPRLPPVLQIDTNNTCNLHCPGCLTGLGLHKQQPRHLPWPQFTTLIDAIRNDVLLAALYNSGEPFLHPRLVDMVQYLTDRGIASMVSTNGHFLADPAKAAKLVTAGLSTLIVSLSGATPATYAQYHRGGNLSTVTESVRQVIRARKQCGRRTPTVILRFLILDNNRHEMAAMKGLARRLGCDVCEFRVVNWQPRLIASPGIPDDSPAMEPDTRQAQRVCLWPWLFATINWDGEVFPCCFYHFGLPSMGNAFAAGSFRRVWYNEPYTKFRKTMRQGKCNLAVCAQCPAEAGFQGKFSRQQRTIYVKHTHG